MRGQKIGGSLSMVRTVSEGSNQSRLICPGFAFVVFTDDQRSQVEEILLDAEKKGHYDRSSAELNIAALAAVPVYWNGWGFEDFKEVNNRGDNLRIIEALGFKPDYLYLSDPSEYLEMHDDLDDPCHCVNAEACRTCRLRERLRIAEADIKHCESVIVAEKARADMIEELWSAFTNVIEKNPHLKCEIDKLGKKYPEANLRMTSEPDNAIASTGFTDAETLRGSAPVDDTDNDPDGDPDSDPGGDSGCDRLDCLVYTPFHGHGRRGKKVNPEADRSRLWEETSANQHSANNGEGQNSPVLAAIPEEDYAFNVSDDEHVDKTCEAAEWRHVKTRDSGKKASASKSSTQKAGLDTKRIRQTGRRTCAGEKGRKHRLDSDYEDDEDYEDVKPQKKLQRSSKSASTNLAKAALHNNNVSTKSKGRNTNNSRSSELDAAGDGIISYEESDEASKTQVGMRKTCAYQDLLSKSMRDDDESKASSATWHPSPAASQSGSAPSQSSSEASQPSSTASEPNVRAILVPKGPSRAFYTSTPPATSITSQSTQSTQSTQTITRTGKPTGWSSTETQALITLITAHRNPEPGPDGKKAAILHDVKLFELMSQQLRTQYGIYRNAGACKNEWNRKGRLMSGIDERKYANAGKLATSVQKK